MVSTIIQHHTNDIIRCTACGNRYEGLWKCDMKNGPGKFMYLDKGQVYTGEWIDDIPVCGMLEDFGRDGAPDPPVYPIPKVLLKYILIMMMKFSPNIHKCSVH